MGLGTYLLFGSFSASVDLAWVVKEAVCWTPHADRKTDR